MNKLLLSFFICCICHSSIAQVEEVVEPKTSSLNFDLNYLSDNVYMGRKDSLPVAYLTPTIRFTSKQGIYAYGSFSYLAKEGWIDQATIGAGYSFAYKGWENDISAEKYFYNTGSYNVRSDIQGTVGLVSGYDFGFIKPTVATYLMFAEKTDLSLSLGLEGTIEVIKEKLSITPAAYLNGSSQNYFGAYTENRSVKGPNRPPRNVSVTSEVLGADKFKLLDYELMASVFLTANNFEFYFIPVFAKPINPNTTRVTVKPVIGPTIVRNNVEVIKGQFFFTIGFNYDLKFKSGK